MARFLLTLATAAIAAAASVDVTPMQIRLAYAGPNAMMVSWNTYSQLPMPTVRYGLSPDVLDRVATSRDSNTYQTSTTFNNHVPIHGLKPDTVYYYQPQFSNSTKPYTFKTSRKAGDKTPYSIAVAVDLGLMGPQGLTTSVGTGAANPLKPGDNNTIQSLQAQGADTDFMWHRKSRAVLDFEPC